MGTIVTDPMSAIHVVSGLEMDDGGPSHTLPKLWSQLTTLGIEVRAYTTFSSDEASASSDNDNEKPWSLFKSPRIFPRSIRRSPDLRRILERDMTAADLCHNHGCWLYPNWAAAWAARRARKPLLISPLGHLDEWSLQYHGWRKRLIRQLIEEKNWRYCSAFIAKSEMEADQLRRLGLRQTICVIPNGLDVDGWSEQVSSEDFFARFPALQRQRLILFLSRIHPKKGLWKLLEAWERLSSPFSGWHLVIAGDNRNPHAEELCRQVGSRPSLGNTVTFTGRLDGRVKRSALAAASLFVLPSYSENFGQAILEALASGLPVITTRGCPWGGILKHQCGWWINMNGQELYETLTAAMRVSEAELRDMGARGRQWALSEFDSKKITMKLVDLYHEVLKR